uniref:Uncharacterized protein n=1 Tax=Glossina pallidipes TaxID=7398 RepID=A0A1B0ACZ3_GLOPL
MHPDIFQDITEIVETCYNHEEWRSRDNPNWHCRYHYRFRNKKCPSLTSEPDYSTPIKRLIIYKLTTKGVFPFCKPRRLDRIGYKAAEMEFGVLVKSGICVPSN